MANYTCIIGKVHVDLVGHSNAPACVHKRTCVYLPTHLRVFSNAPACVRQHSSVRFASVFPTFCYKNGYLARHFLSFEVRISIFFAAVMCAKYREKYRNEGFPYAF